MSFLVGKNNRSYASPLVPLWRVLPSIRTYRARLWYRKRESGRIDPDVPVHVRKWARGRGARAKMVKACTAVVVLLVLVFSLRVSTPA